MKDELVSKKTAILAKEKNFNEMTLYVFSKDKDDNWISSQDGGADYWNTYKNAIAHPTQSLLARWLREEHDIHIKMDWSWNLTHNTFYSVIYHPSHTPIDGTCAYFTYEEAFEAGLLEALKLI